MYFAESNTSGSSEPYVPGSFSAKAKRPSQTTIITAAVAAAATTTSGSAAVALANSFDKSIHQVTDWLLAEKEMLRKQPVVIGDIDGILAGIEKQKVRIN